MNCKNSTKPDPCCNRERRWEWLLGSSAVVFAVGLVPVLLYRLVMWLHGKRLKHRKKRQPSGQKTKQKEEADTEGAPVVEWTQEIYEWSSEIASAQSLPGRIIALCMLLLNISSLLLYLIDASNLNQPRLGMEICESWIDSPIMQVDTTLNLMFLVHAAIRLMASQNPIWFWIDSATLVDIATIPPCILSMWMNQRWLGLRFTRALRLMILPDVLQHMGILSARRGVRLCQLVTLFVSLFLAAAGLIHLIENTGDPPNYGNSNSLTYFECVYFMIVTMSTVGYGEITCKTTTGRFFISLFILCGLALFANSIPEIAEILGSRNPWSGDYTKDHGKHHVVVCGHITVESISSFLADFLHEDRENVEADIVILDPQSPDLEMQAMLKRHYPQVQYYMGSVMNQRDLTRIALETAHACLIINNKNCRDPDAEDASNIMRVISVKNAAPRLRVIVQLMQYHNKSFLLNIPSWNWANGDEVVCIAELELGFLAQSCLSPGFSTLLANLFTMRAFDSSLDVPSWVMNYTQGAGMEMYTECLSPAFIGLNFREAADLCFTKLNLLLIAIEARGVDGGDSCIAINPRDHLRIEANCQGFFVAQAEEDVKKVFYYCRACHSDVVNIQLVQPCRCAEQSRFLASIATRSSDRRKRLPSSSSGPPPTPTSKKPKQQTRQVAATELGSTLLSEAERINGLPGRHFDSTGMFHWCETRDFMEAQLMSEELGMTVFSDHIVVCVFAHEACPLIGLRNFVLPLRASNFRSCELKHIIFLGPADYLRREWPTLSNFPKVSIIAGSPLNRALLRAINIQLCAMCVILSAKSSSAFSGEEGNLQDKEAILCSLNIKAMTFDGGLTGDMCVPMITALAGDNNVQFLDQDDEDDPDTELFMTQPFACGTAFAAGVLDSLLSTAYFNENALTLIRTLITGGATPELEAILAEGCGICGAFASVESLANRDRSRVAQLPIAEGVLKACYNPDLSYGELFSLALKKFGILAIGLYRVIPGREIPEGVPAGAVQRKRFVITNPPKEFALQGTDRLFCLQPFDEKLNGTEQFE